MGSGCQTAKFYGQAIQGQFQLVAHRQSISKLIADPQTPPPLKRRLETVMQLREFAEAELKLRTEGQYLKYVDVHRPYVVWNVEAAGPYSLVSKTWWYPFVGWLEYRGYFSQRMAKAYAAKLQRDGYDVFVGGVTAYSTLGWFHDPVLNTFIEEPEADLAEVLFHELSHQRVFAHGDTDFNEAFATTVGEEGARRWLQAKGDAAALEHYRQARERNNQFVRLVMGARARLLEVYGEALTEDGEIKSVRNLDQVPRAQLQREKERVFNDLRRDYAQLKKAWGGVTDYDGWFGASLNNAQMNSVTTYYEFVPRFQQLLAENGGDLAKFYQAAERLAKAPRKTRHEWLRGR